MGFSISKANINDSFFKAKETANVIKEKLNQYIYKILNEENEIEPQDPSQQ